MLSEEATDSQVKHAIVLEEDKGVKLLKYLQKRYRQIPRGLLEKSLRKGWVRIDGRRVKSDRVLEEGERLRLPYFFEDSSKRDSYKPSEQDQKALEGMEICRTERYIYFDKPAGLSIQGGSGLRKNMDGMLWGYKGEYKLRLIHRLDKDTSGIVAVARTLSSAREGSLLFAKGEVTKLYLALVWGIFEKSGVIEDKIDGKDATTLYKREWYSKEQGVSLLSMVPKTGRKHQLRLHTKMVGDGIVGDKRYGKRVKGFRLMLHNGLLGLEGDRLVSIGPDRKFMELLLDFGYEGNLEEVKTLWQGWQDEMFL